MRWDRLFDDLEARAAAEEGRALDAEVADRVRRERAQLDLQTRLLAQAGAAQVGLRVAGGGVVSGRLLDVGPDWVLVEPVPGRAVLVVLAAVRRVDGLARGARTPSVLARRFGLGAVLRAVSRDRAPVELVDLDGAHLTGTIDVVGADHLELAEHAADEPRRTANVTAVVGVPFSALCTVRRL